MKLRWRNFTGTTSNEITEREKQHKGLVRRAAAEGFVLLKNEDCLLPLKRGSKLALYGAGAGKTIKGGIGSGDVNERESIDIYRGLAQAGYQITTEEWLSAYDRCQRAAREAWSSTIQRKMEEEKLPFYLAYFTTPFEIPAGSIPGEEAERDEADAAVYVLSRISGEGADRKAARGDYFLSDEEFSLLKRIGECYSKVILVLNTGGIVDLGFTEEIPSIKAILQFGQAGQEGGNALADVISGDVTPSGKLTDTWAYCYEDYPTARFPNRSENKRQVEYREGIYVGYRYFDTFDIPARYTFGYGLSYTDFSVKALNIALSGEEGDPQLTVTAEVKNSGQQYAGKEVVQVYVSCPQGRLAKEFRRLAGFVKTKELAPGEAQVITLSFSIASLSSYEEEQAAWILESGCYGIWLGNALCNVRLIGTAVLAEEVMLRSCGAICAKQTQIEEILPDLAAQKRREEGWRREAKEQELPCVMLPHFLYTPKKLAVSEAFRAVSKEAEALVKRLTKEELIAVTVGALDGQSQGLIGAAGKSVPGAAAETTSVLSGEPYRVASVVLADGPAGLRLRQSYQVKDGELVESGAIGELEQQFFPKKAVTEGMTYYQYCTAMPVGTLLAQSWNPALAEELGGMVGREMELFEISLWLAPGMNIHRNPLGGRNFEYYSEDPLLTGKIAAAVTRGVQSVAGCGATIKHFACNNQEEERLNSDSVVSERALREIYLRGFEITVKEAQPMAVMTAYNKINGIYAANNYDLCTEVLRGEWNFAGIVMTDWATTLSAEDGTCSAAGCIAAGNDLIMPGSEIDCDSIRRAAEGGTLPKEALRDCAYRNIRMILQTNQYENAPAYQDQFIW